MIFINSFSKAKGTVTVFNFDFSPLITTTSRFAQPSVFAKNSHRHEFALPSSGAEAMRTHRRLSLIPANSFFEAPGMAFIEMCTVLSIILNQSSNV